MFSGHPLLWLALLTFIVIAAIAIWSLVSTRRRQKYGRNVAGLGNENDPIVGSTADTRTPYMQQANTDPEPKARVRQAR